MTDNATANSSSSNERFRQLESQLDDARRELEATRVRLAEAEEEHDAAIEEVRLMNEELQARNRDLQSSREELSLANRRLDEQVQRLARVNDDLANLLRSTDIATLFLDRDFRILRYTPATLTLFRLIPADVGRPLSDVAPRFDAADLQDDVHAVLRTLTPVEREVSSSDGGWFLQRVLPYRTSDERVAGVVVTFTDVTARKRAEEAVRSANASLEAEVRQRTASARLLQDVAVIANDSESLAEAARRAVHRVAEVVNWPVAHAYLAEQRGESGTPELVEVGLWHCPAGEGLVAAAESLRQARLAPGEGLAGRVFVRGERDWTRHPSGGTAEEEARRVRAAFAFPIVVADRVEGVLEFFTDEDAEPPAILWESTARIGTQLGRVLERERARHAQRALTAEVLHVEQVERRKLAEELHDQLGQTLDVSLMKLTVARGSEGEKAGAFLDEVAELIRSASRMTRTLTFQLSPPILYDLGLKPALEWLAGELGRMYDLSVRVEGDDAPDAMGERMRFLLFRSIRELLVNVAKHAETGEATVVLETTRDGVRVVVEDRGRGFDPSGPLHEAEGGFGLFSVRERIEHAGGTVTVDSRPGAGTRIVLEIDRNAMSEFEEAE